MDAVSAYKNVEYCLNLIDFQNASPVIYWRGVFWYIHTHDRPFGNIVITKFTDPITPEYSLRQPYSKGKFLGEIILTADSLHPHFDPIIQEIPIELIPIT